MTKPTNIDEYISGFPKETQKKLEQLRAAIKKAAPGAEEVISYAIPAFKLKGMLVLVCSAFSSHWLLSKRFRNRGVSKRTIGL